MNKWMKVSVVIAFAAILGACSSTASKKAGDMSGAAGGMEDSGSAMVDSNTGKGSSMSDRSGAKGDALADNAGLLANRIVYFDFDSSTIRSDDRAIVGAHSNYLAQHSNVKVALEGHADERGSREYNVALGERRATAVRQAMTLQGVSASQISTVSYGEERPSAMGHDEASWRMNRRVEIVYKSR